MMDPRSWQDEFEHRLLEQNIQTAQVLGAAVAMRDHGTGEHNFRVALYAGALGEALGFESATMRALLAGAFLHDIGKIAIPDRILLKAGRLSAEAVEKMHQHCELGAQLLEELPAFQSAIAVVRYHHERYDGSGYPKGLAGEEIPKIARAFSIVDVFDALISERPYKPAFQLEEVVKLLGAGIGRHFDPHFVPPFLELLPAIYLKFGQLSETSLKPHMAELRLRHFGV
jgi:putative nucleotidyltransferase with HDIG domain